MGMAVIRDRFARQGLGLHNDLQNEHSIVGNNVGVLLMSEYGTEEQKNHFLPRLARGEEIPCFGLTGPTAGSDATSIPDYGIVCKQKVGGKEVLGLRLNFDKRYITLAPVATLIGIAFRMYDPDGLLGDKEDLGISLALVPRKTEALEVGRRGILEHHGVEMLGAQEDVIEKAEDRTLFKQELSPGMIAIDANQGLV